MNDPVAAEIELARMLPKVRDDECWGNPCEHDIALSRHILSDPATRQALGAALLDEANTHRCSKCGMHAESSIHATGSANPEIRTAAHTFVPQVTVETALRETLERFDATIVLDPKKGYHYGSGPSVEFVAKGVAARLRATPQETKP